MIIGLLNIIHVSYTIKHSKGNKEEIPEIELKVLDGSDRGVT